MKESAQNSAQIADHFFRHESSKLRAALTHVLGTQYLDLCEDVVQEALYRALSKWSVGGLPPDPSGWIFKTARNIAIDYIRRDKLFQGKADEIIHHLNQLNTEETYRETQIEDSLLRMMFACCHPELSVETQIIMTLKILCSFHNREIASALLKKESAIEKAVGRGKQKMREIVDLETIALDMDLDERLDNVLSAIYLLFNEGYKASTGEQLIKEAMVLEAIRLGRLLAGHPKTDQPRVNALLALLLFNSSRLSTRVSPEGDLLLLQEQNRTEWNKVLIEEGQKFLNKASVGEDISQYHLLAGISACHAFAEKFEATDWHLILSLYDLLVVENASPVFLLNRIVAILYVHGAEDALVELVKLKKEKQMAQYYLYYMVWAEVTKKLGQVNDSVDYLKQALELTNNETEKKYIQNRILNT